MGRDGGKGGRGRGRRSDEKGGGGRVKMVDREIEALEAAIEVRVARRSAADGTAATFYGLHDILVRREGNPPDVTVPFSFVSYH